MAAGEVRIEDLSTLVTIHDNDLAILVDSTETSDETAKKITVSALKAYLNSGENIVVKQTTGVSITDTMSQKAITDAINAIVEDLAIGDF